MYLCVYLYGVTLILLRIQRIRPFMNTPEIANCWYSHTQTRERWAHTLRTRICIHVLTRVHLGAKTVSHVCANLVASKQHSGLILQVFARHLVEMASKMPLWQIEVCVTGLIYEVPTPGLICMVVMHACVHVYCACLANTFDSHLSLSVSW